jgi:hypothetical protein
MNVKFFLDRVTIFLSTPGYALTSHDFANKEEERERTFIHFV